MSYKTFGISIGYIVICASYVKQRLDAYIENLLNLSWHVDLPTFPIANNAEIKLSDMMITDRKWDSCSGPYPMFRGSGK